MNYREQVRKFLSEWIGFVSYGIGVLFILGLIIQNVYLSKYGITDLPIFKVQYVVTGFIFIAFLTYPIIAVYLPYRLGFKGSKKGPPEGSYVRKIKRWLLQATVVFFSWLVATAAYVMLFQFLSKEHIFWEKSDKVNLLLFGLFLVDAVVFTFIMYRGIFLKDPRRTERGQGPSSLADLRYIKTAVYAILYFVSVFYIYPLSVYPLISRSFSGGKPMLADIRLSEQYVKMGHDLEEGLISSCVMREQEVVYIDTENLYLLRIRKGLIRSRTLVIPKRYVEYMILYREKEQSERKKPTDVKIAEENEKTALKN